MSDDYYTDQAKGTFAQYQQIAGAIDPPRKRLWWERQGGLRWPFAMAWKLYRWAVYRK